MLSKDSLQKFINSYEEKGWVVVNGVFDERAVDEILKISEATIDSELAEGKIHSLDKGQDGKVAPRKLDSPFKKNEAFKQFLSNPNLQQLLKGFLDSEVCLLADQLFLKPPFVGSEKPYHQDNKYFLCTPIDKLITAWIALDDVDIENGCVRYIDGSHRKPLVPHAQVNNYDLAIPPEYLDLSKESLGVVKKGGVIFHHGHIMHKSGENKSNRWRRGYATHWAIPSIETKSEQIENGYFYSFEKNRKNREKPECVH